MYITMQLLIRRTEIIAILRHHAIKTYCGRQGLVKVIGGRGAKPPSTQADFPDSDDDKERHCFSGRNIWKPCKRPWDCNLRVLTTLSIAICGSSGGQSSSSSSVERVGR